jgi:hypothetical protein
MKLPLFLLILSFNLIPQLSYAKSVIVPPVVEQHMDQALKEQQCQEDWVNEFKEAKYVKAQSPEQQLLFIPCANWGRNPTWKVFLVVAEPNSEDVFVKSIKFIRYNSNSGLYADDQVSNIQWNQAEFSLHTFRTLNGTQACGDIARYKWNSTAQEFSIVGIAKSDDCRTSKWEKLEINWKPVSQ